MAKRIMRMQILAMLLLLFLFPLSFLQIHAKEEKKTIDYAISPNKPDKFQMPITVYSGEGIDYFSGVYRTSIPIFVPPGRGGADTKCGTGV